MDLAWLLPTLITAAFNGLALYLALSKGSKKTAEGFLDVLEKYSKENPTAKRAKKILEKFDEMFEKNDIDELIVSIKKFFEEASELVSSPEAKNFFKNISEMMKELSGGEEETKIKLPKKPTQKK